MVELLLAYGSDTNAKDLAGCTVAHYATYAGRLDVMYALKDKSIDWNAKANTRNLGLSRTCATVCM